MKKTRKTNENVKNRFQKLGLTIALTLSLISGITPAVAQAQTPTTATNTAEITTKLKLTKDTVKQNESLEVSWHTSKANIKNWIGIYPITVSSPSGAPGALLWEYAPDNEGNLHFDTASLAPGRYRVWLLANNGYTPLASSELFSVIHVGEKTPGNPVSPIKTDPSTDHVIYREGFETTSLPLNWQTTHNNQMNNTGIGAWRGWKIVPYDQWSSGIDKMRGRFGRAHGNIAVADPAAYLGKPFTATLTSDPIPVAKHSQLELTFDSHYRSWKGQEGSVTVSYDDKIPTEILRLNENNVTDGADDKQMNAQHHLKLKVPTGAKTAKFSWHLDAPQSGWYWGIDSVAVHLPLKKTTGPATSAWIVSDIQGHPKDLESGLQKLSQILPDAQALVMAGDIVPTGNQLEWNEINTVMENTKTIRPKTTIAAIGNHDRNTPDGWQANRDRFLKFANRGKIWAEYLIEGPGGALPIIAFGQDLPVPLEAPMSEEQLAFIEERLSYWAKRKTQVVLTTHYPLGNTVSGSWMPILQHEHQRNDQLTALFGAYPNVILLTGHTHFDGRLADWQVKRRTDGGHPDGFHAINTTGMHDGWAASGEISKIATEIPTKDMNQALTLESYKDRVVIKAYDFKTNEKINEVTIDNPLAK